MHAQDEDHPVVESRDLTPPPATRRILNRHQQHAQAIPGRLIIGCTRIVESVITSKLPGILLTIISQRSSIISFPRPLACRLCDLPATGLGKSNLLGRNIVAFPCLIVPLPRDAT